MKCPMCDGSGVNGGVHYVTHDMALDACEPDMEGMEIEDYEQCEMCCGTGEIEDDGGEE